MPGRFTPLNPAATLSNLVAQVNKNFAVLDNENVTKVFKNGSSNAVTIGRYSSDGGMRYGLLISDASGVPRILIGQAPDDQRPGVWISKDNENVLELLGD
jgi:hypothetical protein